MTKEINLEIYAMGVGSGVGLGLTLREKGGSWDSKWMDMEVGSSAVIYGARISLVEIANKKATFIVSAAPTPTPSRYPR